MTSDVHSNPGHIYTSFLFVRYRAVILAVIPGIPLTTLIAVTWNTSSLWSVVWGLSIFSLITLMFTFSRQVLGIPRMAGLLLFAYLLRVGVAFLTSIDQFRMRGDEILYDRLARQIQWAWQNGDFTRVHNLGNWYPEIGGVLYFVFGDSFLVARFFNCVLGVFVTWAAYRLTLAATDDGRAAFWTAVLVTISPQMVLISALQRKDTLIILSTIIIVGMALAMERQPRRLSNWFWFLMGLALLMTIRLESAVLLGALCLAYFVCIFGSQRSLGTKLVIVGVAIAISFALPTLWQAATELGLRVEHGDSERKLESNTSAVSQIAGEQSGNGISGNLRTQSILFLRSLLIPHPFYTLRANGIEPTFLAIDGILWFSVIIPFAVIGLLHNWRNPSVLFLLSCAVITMWLLSTPAIALGSEPIRYRLPIVPLIYVIAAVGISTFQQTPRFLRRRFYFFFSMCVGLVLGVFLLYIRSLS